MQRSHVVTCIVSTASSVLAMYWTSTRIAMTLTISIPAMPFT